MTERPGRPILVLLTANLLTRTGSPPDRHCNGQAARDLGVRRCRALPWIAAPGHQASAAEEAAPDILKTLGLGDTSFEKKDTYHP